MVGIAGRRAVIGDLGTDDVALEGGVVDARGAHLHRHHVRRGLRDGLGRLPGLVLEHAQVEGVLEQPHAGGRRDVVGRGVVVGGRPQDVVPRDAERRIEELFDSALDEVLGQVVVGLDKGDLLAVGPLHDERPDRQA